MFTEPSELCSGNRLVGSRSLRQKCFVCRRVALLRIRRTAFRIITAQGFHRARHPSTEPRSKVMERIYAALRLKPRKAFVARFEHPLNRAATCRNVVPIATVDMTTSVAQHVAPLCTPPPPPLPPPLPLPLRASVCVRVRRAVKDTALISNKHLVVLLQ